MDSTVHLRLLFFFLWWIICGTFHSIRALQPTGAMWLTVGKRNYFTGYWFLLHNYASCLWLYISLATLRNFMGMWLFSWSNFAYPQCDVNIPHYSDTHCRFCVARYHLRVSCLIHRTFAYFNDDLVTEKHLCQSITTIILCHEYGWHRYATPRNAIGRWMGMDDSSRFWDFSSDWSWFSERGSEYHLPTIYHQI